jgi:hypothetical protein
LERIGAMQADDEKILRMAKEIIVKFIELGRVSPGNFDEHFRGVFWTLKDTVINAQLTGLDQTALKGSPKADEPQEEEDS